MDEFEFPALRYLGRLKQLRLGHSGRGLFSAWLPESVIVEEALAGGERGAAWVFTVGRWVEKRTGCQVTALAQVRSRYDSLSNC